MDILNFPAKSNRYEKNKHYETIREHTDKLLQQAELLIDLGLVSSEEMKSDLMTSCEYHDYGKGNSVFKKRIENNTKFNEESEIPHNVLSVFFINKSDCINYNAVCFAVVYHHYNVQSPVDVLNNKRDLIKKFLNEFFGEKDANDKLKSSRRIVKSLNDTFQTSFDDSQKLYAVLLKGFLHKCDYSASAGLEKCEISNTFLVDCMENWKTQKFIELNELQKFCLQNSDSDIIVTAPTGMGKTEAGLFWCKNNKCFFVLPLKTAINAMFDRFVNLFGEDYENKVALIHSDMNSEYIKYFKDKNNSDENINLQYCLKSKQMSLPVTVCTPDQIFDFVLKYPGYEYKLATASYSKFIIDEIQMYSPDLMAAIICAINMIHKAGGKIAILTATLPPFVRSEIKKILGNDVPEKDFSEYGLLRHNIKVFEKEMYSEFIADTIRNTKNDKVKKYLVICNSIDTASLMFEQLKDEFCDDNIEVNMFHAGFIKKDRQEKETKILQASEDENYSGIWISTSVVEASLDIDFDILFTELSDLFSLFQRFGRVNRKGKKSIEKTNCYVFTELQGNAKRFHFYDKDIHDLSKKAILTVNDRVVDEKIKSELIETYLSCENVKSSEYYEKYCNSLKYYSELKDYLSEKKDGLRSIDRIDVIPIDEYEKNKDEIDKNVDIINDHNASRKERISANEEIMKYTVSVSNYRANKNNRESYVAFGYKSIPVLKNCEYSFEKGIIFKDSQDEKSTNNIDTII